MRHSPGLPMRRAMVRCCALCTPGGPATAAPPAGEAESLALTRRDHTLDPREAQGIRLGDMPLPEKSGGRMAPVACNGDHGSRSDALTLERGKGIRRGGDGLALRLMSLRDTAWVGASFAAVDAEQ